MCTEDEEFYPTGGHLSAGQDPWTVSVGDCDWTHPWDCVTDAFDAIKSIPGIGAVAQLAEDFSNTALGKAFFAVLAPAMAAELFTQLPGIGMHIADGLSKLGPVATEMLPGLTRGERVDKAFIASVKSVAQRALAAGGGGEAANEAAKLAGPYVTQATTVATDALKSLGTTPAQIMAMTDDLRRQAGLTTADQILPRELQDKLDAAMKPYLDRLDVKALARQAGVPDDIMQVAIDGVTRTMNYAPQNYDANGNVATNAQLAAKAVDDMLLDDTIGSHIEIDFSSGIPTPKTVGGRYLSAQEVLDMATKRAAEDGGALGQLANWTYIGGRLKALAAAGQRPDEIIGVVTMSPAIKLAATPAQVDDYLVSLIMNKSIPIAQIAAYAKADPTAPKPIPASLTTLTAIQRLDARSKWLRSQWGAHVSGLTMALSSAAPKPPPPAIYVAPVVAKGGVTRAAVPAEYTAMADAIDKAIATYRAANNQFMLSAAPVTIAPAAAAPALAPYDKLAERAKWTSFYLGFASTMHTAGAWWPR